LGKIKAKCEKNSCKIWVKVIRFGLNQNLASPKTLNFLRLCPLPTTFFYDIFY